MDNKEQLSAALNQAVTQNLDQIVDEIWAVYDGSALQRANELLKEREKTERELRVEIHRLRLKCGEVKL